MVSKNKKVLLPCKYCGEFPHIFFGYSYCSSKHFVNISCNNDKCGFGINSYTSVFDAIKSWNECQNGFDYITTPFYDSEYSYIAQKFFCVINNLPLFLPKDKCFSCGINIYDFISVEYAAAVHITECPHCHRSFCY